jgi:Trk K+ transport system NAD-binding subunit
MKDKVIVIGAGSISAFVAAQLSKMHPDAQIITPEEAIERNKPKYEIPEIKIHTPAKDGKQLRRERRAAQRNKKQ